jgi:cytochrome P450
MITYRAKPKVNLPQGPKGKGLMGNTKAFINERFEMMRHCTEDYDGIVFTRIAFRNVYVVSKPEYVYHVLQKNAKNYHKSANYEGLRPLLGNGLLTNEDASWFSQRRLMQPAFHREPLANMIGIMAQRTQEALDKWETEYKDQFFDLGHEMRMIASDIVTRALFGSDADDKSEAVGDHLKVLLKYANEKIVNPFRLGLHYPTAENKKIKASIADLDEIILAIITKRREHDGPPKPDLLEMLLNAQDADTGERMNDRQLRDELMTLYLAGQETTQHALTFAFYLLGKAPEVCKRLQDEAQNVLHGEHPTFEQVPHLQYAKQVVNESMRLYPPIWAVSRRAVSDDEIGGFTIPKDSTVFIPIYGVHRNAHSWENATEFNPDRFTPEAEKSISKNTFFPFGSGPRICIGNHFAMFEMQVVLAMVAERFVPELQSAAPLELVTNMTMRPKDAVMVRMVAVRQV